MEQTSEPLSPSLRRVLGHDAPLSPSVRRMVSNDGEARRTLRNLDLREHKVYKITCQTNGKAYIGKTKRTIHARWRAHCGKGSGCHALSGAIRKYGKAAFRIHVLASGLTNDEANAFECDMIVAHNTRAPAGYNLVAGGQGSADINPNHGRNIAAAWKRPETRERHMAWRTTQRLRDKANQEDTWKRQQAAWMQRRLEKALEMPVRDAIDMIVYRTTKALEHARRQGRPEEWKAWMLEQKHMQIVAVCNAAGVPIPQASSCAQSTNAYERKLARERGWAK